jgi:hypothetical protein
MMPKKKTKTEIAYGRTPTGQLVYDLGFARLTDKWLARKHRIPVNQIRAIRATVKRALRPVRKKK